MRGLRFAPIFAAALLFILVAHHHPAGVTATNPCSVCVSHGSATIDTPAELARPTVWHAHTTPAAALTRDADLVAAATRGPPAA